MDISISSELIEYLKRKGHDTIVVDVATADHSDIEVSEIFLRTCKDAHRRYLMEKRGYLEKAFYKLPATDNHDESSSNEQGIHILFPKYKFELDEEISFFMQKKFFFVSIKVRGIRL